MTVVLMNLLKPVCPRGARVIPLTRGKYALVSAEDYDRITQLSWCAGPRKSSAKSWHRGHPVLLHRFILGAADGVQVDHINHDVLDNRRCNLRVATPQQNSANMRMCSNNRSGAKGVVWDAGRKKWAAFIKVNYKSIGLGRFDTKEAAAQAYANAARKYFGDFAFTGVQS